MEIINNKQVKVSTSAELKDALENDNGYDYIYLGNDITLDSGISINGTKEKIIIDGTYLNNRYTLTGIASSEANDTILANLNNSEIILKNMNIVSPNIYGIVYAPLNRGYADVLICYDNVTFNGTQLSYNPYGKVKIIDSRITIEETLGITAQEVCEVNYVIIGGTTTILSNSTSSSLFYFRNDSSPNIVFLCQSNITMTTENKEFMAGTNKLNFTILHDTTVNLVTGNGFSSNPVYGANNVLIEERATFSFIEKSHQRVPMWVVNGTFTMKKGSNLELINSYDATPDDNYNIHFKGGNCKLILDNPNSIVIYTKNSNVIYTNNEMSFEIRCSRINMWNNSTSLTSAGSLENLYDYSWGKDDGLLEVNGTFSSTETVITSHNLTTEELKVLPDLSNFVFQSRKQLSIGNNYINVHPISTVKNKISGHTISMADVLIRYNGVEEIVYADVDGFFEYSFIDTIPDDTEVIFISNIASSFIYGVRTVKTPYDGELSLMDATEVFTFSKVSLSENPYMFIKNNDFLVRVVDSRVNSTNWKLYACIERPLTSQNGYTLEDSLVFKKFDNDIVALDSNKTLVYMGSDNTNGVIKKDINWSKEKGPLLDLSNSYLEINEEYFAEIKLILEE